MAERKVERVKVPVRVFPLPEAIPAHKGAAKQPAAWRIRESGASVPHVQMERGEMAVPLGDDAMSECVRAHETGHARWSPARPPADLAVDVIQAVEDARVHSLLKSTGVDMSAGLVPPAAIAESVKRMMAGTPSEGPDRRGLVLSYLASLHTGSAAHVSEALREADDTLVEDVSGLVGEAWRMLHSERKRPRFEDTRRVAEWLQAMLATAEEAREAEREAARKVAKRKLDALTEEEAAAVAMADEPMTAEERREVEGAAERPVVSGRAADVNTWGEMTVERPPLSQPMPRRTAVRRKRPAQEGDVPRRLERYCVDQAVFVAGRRERRGTVLIDQSGSMSMSAADVLAILAVAPAARIAAYAGSGGRGVLRVLADRGRRVADAWVHVRLGGNVVDGPALRWLAKQPGPRLWVCDGVVTGCADTPASNLNTEAARIVRAGGIRRVPSVELAVKVMAQMGRR
jgi:hypothetical protein